MNQEIRLPLMTMEEFLALPEDGMDRDLICGEMREKPMTRRIFRHSKLEAAIAQLLGTWRRTLPKPWGEVLSGEAGFRIRQNPDTTVGLVVAYISSDLAAKTPKNAKVVDGLPLLAVEILSPSDTQEDLTDRIGEFLAVKIPLVWLVEPVFQTITVYRPDAQPQLFNIEQRLTGDPHLPGFAVELKELFEVE